MSKKISRIKKSKSKKKLVCLTAYSKPIARILDKYCDIVLVGDSVATALYGMSNTKNITLKGIGNWLLSNSLEIINREPNIIVIMEDTKNADVN